MVVETLLHFLESIAFLGGTGFLGITAFFLRDIHVRFRQAELKISEHTGRIMVLERITEGRR